MENAPAKLGTEDLKKCLALGLEIANVVDKMGRTTGAAKYGHLLMLIDEASSIGSIDFKSVMPQVKDLDAEEKAALLAFAKEKLDLADDKLEAAVEGGLALVVKAADLYAEGAALIKSLKS